MGELFDLDRLDDTDPFEIDRQAAHLFKSNPYGIDDIAGEVLMAPLASSDHDDPTRCRPIGCYLAAKHLADLYNEDR